MVIPAAAIAAFVLCYAGLSGLCLAMDRHHQQVLQRCSSEAWMKALRAIGWLLLALSGVSCVLGWGASVGVVAWFGIVPAAALLIVVLLPYAPRAVARGALVAGVVGLLMLVCAVRG